MPDSLLLNGKKFYYDEIRDYSFRNSIPIDGYEAKTLEFCRDWLNGVQEFPILTSGSTGTPKKINLTRQQLEASANKTIRLLHLQPGDTTLICLNTEYIAGMMMLVRGFLAELEMVVVEPVSNPLALLPENVQPDFASFVPLQLQTMLQQTPAAVAVLNHMKGILVGGAPVSPALQQELQQLKVPVYHTYGMTETASHVAVRLLNGPEAAAYYEALPGVEISQDSRGCLTIKADVTNNEPIVTNDLVELLSSTRFRWIGRAGNTVNTGGVKVQLEKVELAVARALAALEMNPRYFVAALPDERLGQKLVLVLEGGPLAADEEEELQSQLRQLLQKYELPRAIYYSASFSETATGKISKQDTLQKLGLKSDRSS
ncbi:AMP-binding protein [Botryobacter ruber]|uniref:AMP-binding protein n=1 Tax=Botryobacter ruber TaxID=2171629 RepID=UPI000E09E896|nr:AMP-binding protein [Botryobacter ruber]